MVAVHRGHPADLARVQAHEGARWEDGDLRKERLDQGGRKGLVLGAHDLADRLVRSEPRPRRRRHRESRVRVDQAEDLGVLVHGGSVEPLRKALRQLALVVLEHCPAAAPGSGSAVGGGPRARARKSWSSAKSGSALSGGGSENAGSTGNASRLAAGSTSRGVSTRGGGVGRDAATGGARGGAGGVSGAVGSLAASAGFSRTMPRTTSLMRTIRRSPPCP